MRFLTLFLMAMAQTASAASPTSPQRHAVHFDFTLSGPASVTKNPCVINVLQSGTAISKELGEFQWVGNAVDHVCTRGMGEGDAVAVSTFTDSKGDTIIATYHTTIHVPDLKTAPTDLSWEGTWEFVGGTGRFANIQGKGTIPNHGLQDVSKVYQCAFDGAFSL